jgi:hypothetical protein
MDVDGKAQSAASSGNRGKKRKIVSPNVDEKKPKSVARRLDFSKAPPTSP